MRLAFFSLLSFVVLPLSLSAQKASPATDSTIYLQSTLLRGNRYVQNGEHHGAGGSFGRLREALVQVPEAYELCDRGSRIVTHGRIVSILGAALGATTFLVHGDVLNYGLSFGGFAVASVGGAIQMKGRNRINEAVWIYNSSGIRSQKSEFPEDTIHQ